MPKSQAVDENGKYTLPSVLSVRTDGWKPAILERINAAMQERYTLEPASHIAAIAFVRDVIGENFAIRDILMPTVRTRVSAYASPQDKEAAQKVAQAARNRETRKALSLMKFVNALQHASDDELKNYGATGHTLDVANMAAFEKWFDAQPEPTPRTHNTANK